VGVIVYAQVLADQAAADAMQPDQIIAALGGQVGVSNAKTVTGIGDKAFEYTSNSTTSGAGVAIFVFRYNVVLMIVMGPSTDSNAIEAMAKAAVDRIGA